MDSYDKWFYSPLDKEEDGKKAYQCIYCNDWIYEDENYFDLGDGPICENCIDDVVSEFKKRA